MKRIVFYDAAAPAPYSDALLGTADNGIGGTEASVARVAAKLSEAHDVTVAQRERRSAEASDRLHWLPFTQTRDKLARADAIVVVRNHKHILSVRRVNSRAPIFLWCHDWYPRVQTFKTLKPRLLRQLKLEGHVALHHFTHATAVGVSETHRRNIREYFDGARVVWPLASRVHVDYVYNPIPDELSRSDAPYDPRKLVFFSTPGKGLDLVLEAFQEVRREMPDMRLHVASPGYGDEQGNNGAELSGNVTFLGKLSHSDIMREVRTALCVFYPANRIPETFGLVFAESHAVGTPVLAHPFGAACELLGNDELIDAGNITAIVARVRAWRNGARPVVYGNDQLRLSNVAEAWERLLFGRS